MSSPPVVCAHRGASLGLPDNSVAAFEAAIAAGCEMIETDVRADRHGRLVLAHEPFGLADGGAVTLATLLELAHGRIGLDLEIKEPAVVPELVDALTGWEGPLLLTSFRPSALRRTRALRSSLSTGLLIRGTHVGDPVQAAQACGAGTLVVAERRLGERLLERSSLALWVWTVNTPARLAHWLADPRIAGVITDDPVTALALRDAPARSLDDGAGTPDPSCFRA